MEVLLGAVCKSRANAHSPWRRIRMCHWFAIKTRDLQYVFTAPDSAGRVRSEVSRCKHQFSRLIDFRKQPNAAHGWVKAVPALVRRVGLMIRDLALSTATSSTQRRNPVYERPGTECVLRGRSSRGFRLFISTPGIATAGVLPAHEDTLHNRYAAACERPNRTGPGDNMDHPREA